MEMSVHSMGSGWLTTRSHWIDQVPSPGHLQCATVSPSSMSQWLSCLVYSIIQPQVISYQPLSVHQLQPTAHQAQKMLLSPVSFFLAVRKAFVPISKSYQSFEVQLKSCITPKVLPLYGTGVTSTLKLPWLYLSYYTVSQLFQEQGLCLHYLWISQDV